MKNDNLTPLNHSSLGKKKVDWSKIAGKKTVHRAVASGKAAGFNETDNKQSSKIMMGLFILLLFQIFAVAAIVIHSKFNNSAIEDSQRGSKTANAYNDKGALDLIEEESAKISNNETFTMVDAGETYQSIANEYGYDEQELRDLNNNRSLKAGVALRTPQRKISVVSPELEAVGNAPEPKVVQVEPNVHRIDIPEQQPKTIVKPGNSETGSSTYFMHRLQPKENFYRLSVKYNVSVSDIQKANAHLNPNKIPVGTPIRIPKK